jgi:hypothetical protein
VRARSSLFRWAGGLLVAASLLQSPSPLPAQAKRAERDGGALRQQPLRGGGREPFLGTRARSSALLPWSSRSCHCPGADLVSVFGIIFLPGAGYFGPVWIWVERRSDHGPAIEESICIFFLLLLFSALPSPMLLGEFWLL